MAITEVNELNERHGPLKSSDFHSEYVRTFEAISDSATESGETVLAHTSLPRLWLPHPDNFNARCIHVDPQRHADDDYYWLVRFRYSTKYDAQIDPATGEEAPTEGDPSDNNPLNRPPKYRILARKYRKTIEREIRSSGVAKTFKNSAGDPYPPKEIEPARMALSVQRNVAIFNYFVIEELIGVATNEATFLGWGPRKVVLDDLSVTFEKDHGVFYADVDAMLLFDNKEWVDERLDAGLNRLVSGVKKPIILDGGQLPSVPQLLDGAGGVLSSTGTPVYNSFYPLEPKDFGPLAVLFT
jgi:hypothetical protein